jgi:hypothetical protein
MILIIHGEEYKFLSSSFCSFLQPLVSRSWFIVMFSKKLIFYDEELSVPNLSPMLEYYLLSAVHDCLFNIFAATLYIWRPSAPFAT